MIRLSRLTDYGISLLAHMAQEEVGHTFTARELAAISGLPLPTVSKVLKQLSHSELVVSKLGVNGGYSIARTPHTITVAEMIDALEGPFALTACTSHPKNQACEFEASCLTKSPWQKINRVVRDALEGLNLAQMTPAQLPLSVIRSKSL